MQCVQADKIERIELNLTLSVSKRCRTLIAEESAKNDRFCKENVTKNDVKEGDFMEVRHNVV